MAASSPLPKLKKLDLYLGADHLPPPLSTSVVIDALLLLFHTLGMHFRPAPPLLFTHCCFTCILTACLPHSSMHFSHSISAVILKAFSPSTLVRAHPTYPCTPVDIHALLQSFPTYPCTSVVIHALLQSYILHEYISHSNLARVPLFCRTRNCRIQTSHAFVLCTSVIVAFKPRTLVVLDRQSAGRHGPEEKGNCGSGSRRPSARRRIPDRGEKKRKEANLVVDV